MIRVFCFFGNLGTILLIAYGLDRRGTPIGWEIAAVSLVFCGALSACYLSYTAKSAEDSWLGLYLLRKKAEERKKIEALTTPRPPALDPGSDPQAPKT